MCGQGFKIREHIHLSFVACHLFHFLSDILILPLFPKYSNDCDAHTFLLGNKENRQGVKSDYKFLGRGQGKLKRLDNSGYATASNQSVRGIYIAKSYALLKLDRKLGFLHRRFLVCNHFPPTSQPRKDERLTILVSNVPPCYKTSWPNVGTARIYGIQKGKGAGTGDIISLFTLADVTEG